MGTTNEGDDVQYVRAELGGIRTLLDELRTEVQAHGAELKLLRKEGISITRLHIPLVVFAALLIPSATAAGFLIQTLRTVDAHTHDHWSHVEPEKAIAGGGVAFVRDLEPLRRPEAPICSLCSVAPP